MTPSMICVVYVSLLVEVGRIGWRRRYTLLFFLLYLFLPAFAYFLFFGSSNSCIRLLSRCFA